MRISLQFLRMTGLFFFSSSIPFAAGFVFNNCCFQQQHQCLRTGTILAGYVDDFHEYLSHQSAAFSSSEDSTKTVVSSSSSPLVMDDSHCGRYSMIPLPDSMMSTTVHVGNLCEFVRDEDLSALFASVSQWQRLPACVARKPTTQSLQYGFVSFPTVQEKEAAIIRFHGLEWKGGRTLRVQPIRDHPKQGRVRVPERLVDYVSGDKRGLRRASRSEKDAAAKTKNRRNQHKNRAMGQHNGRSRMGRLSEQDQTELNRAIRKGFLTLSGGNPDRFQETSALYRAHRVWCAESQKPQIVYFKPQQQGQTLEDQVQIDVSTVRFLANPDAEMMWENYCHDVGSARQAAGMVTQDGSFDTLTAEIQSTTGPQAWASRPISKLPKIRLGTHVGERSRAKEMAKTLAKRWSIPERVDHESSALEEDATLSSSSSGSQSRFRRQDRYLNNRHAAMGMKKSNNRAHAHMHKGLSEHRKRGGGHRQSWY